MLRSATFLTAGVFGLGLLCGPVFANQGGNDNDDRGGGGRESIETFVREYIDLRFFQNRSQKIVELFLIKLEPRLHQGGTNGGDNLRPHRQVLIEARVVEVTNVDKMDLSDVPFLGSLVGPEFNGDDLQDDSKVGNVFLTGTNGLFVVLEPTALGDPGTLNLDRVVLFNDDYSQEVKPLQLDRTPDAAEVEQVLGELAPLPSVRSVTTEVTVPDGGTILLGGLSRDVAANDEEQVPFLEDLPVLGSLFAGTAHQHDRSNLLILIKPSILVQSERD